MTEPSLAAEATMRELGDLALGRARATGTAVVVCAFVDSTSASVSNVDLETGEVDDETTVTLPPVRRLYP